MKFTRDAFTSGAVGEERFTYVGPARRLLGTFNFQQAITPVNPLSQAGQTQLAALRAQAAQQAGGTSIDFTGQEIKYPDSQNLGDTIGDERSLFEKAKDRIEN